MLSRSQKLSTEQFTAVMEKGRIIHSPFFQMRVIPAPGSDTKAVTITKAQHVRIAAVAPQKIFKSAVQRNKAKRTIYTGVQPLYANLSPVFALLIAKTPILTATPQAIAEDLKTLFVKAGIMK